MVEEHMVFSNAIELLFNVAHGKKLQPAIKERLEQVGINIAKPLPAYPVATFCKAIETTGPLLYPGLSPNDAAYQMGVALVANAEANLIGKAVMSMARLVGARRIIPRLKSSWRAANNYTEIAVKELSNNEFLLTFNEPGILQWYSLGSLEQGFQMIGGKKTTVTIDTASPTSVTYRILIS